MVRELLVLIWLGDAHTSISLSSSRDQSNRVFSSWETISETLKYWLLGCAIRQYDAFTQPRIYLTGSGALVAAAALDADDWVDDLLPAVDLLAFVVGDAHQSHLVQHGADAGTLRWNRGTIWDHATYGAYLCATPKTYFLLVKDRSNKMVNSSNGPAAKLLTWSAFVWSNLIKFDQV